MNFSSLLQRSEGDALDFKRENYRFKNASDEEKCELLKDILALGNAWKATDAFIVIGVEEVNGKPAGLPGVTPELDDSDVQQFVNSKTNRPIAFAVEHVDYQGAPLTIIRVAQKQARPIFLNKTYGRLKKNVVYIRHGSSTDEASPDEIAEMAKQEVTVSAPDVELLFRVTVDAFCYRNEFAIGVRKEEPTYFDGFGLVARNNGNALARHIEGAIELPRGVFVSHLKQGDLKERDPVAAVAQTKSIKLEFSNYMREPRGHYLAKPNPLEWKPLLPGRELELFTEKTLPLRNRFHEMDASIRWELAVDNCRMQRGETRFTEIAIIPKSD